MAITKYIMNKVKLDRIQPFHKLPKFKLLLQLLDETGVVGGLELGVLADTLDKSASKSDPLFALKLDRL